MTKRINLCVLFGGKSAEHYGSIESAIHVLAYINKEKYTIHAIYVKEDGSLAAPAEFVENIPRFLEDEKVYTFSTDYVPESGFSDTLESYAVFPANSDIHKVNFFDNVLEGVYDLVFPIFHGKNGEDGSIQGLLEFINVPYAGCGIAGSCNSMDKEITKRIAIGHGIPVPEFMSFKQYEWLENHVTILKKLDETFTYPVFIKPVSLGSSIGITKAGDKQELTDGIEIGFQYDNKIIIEQGYENREFAVSMIGNEKPLMSAIAEFKSCNDFFDYEAKYGPNSIASIIPADIDKELEKKIYDLALKVYRDFDLAGMSRIDFFYINNKLYLNEINSIPGLELIGTFYKQWKATGVSKEALIDMVISYGFEKHSLKNIR